jgi:hypothetical protein
MYLGASVGADSDSVGVRMLVGRRSIAIRYDGGDADGKVKISDK